MCFDFKLETKRYGCANHNNPESNNTVETQSSLTIHLANHESTHVPFYELCKGRFDGIEQTYYIALL